MSDMARPPGLFRRKESSTWYYRVRVPSDLLHAYNGRKEIRVNLKTSDFKSAKRERDLAALGVTQEFERIRAAARGDGALSDPMPTQPKPEWLLRIAEYVRAEDRKRERTFLETDWSSDTQRRGDAIENTFEAIHFFTDPSHHITQEQISVAACEIFGAAFWGSGLSSGEGARLSELIRYALLEVERRELARLRGHYPSFLTGIPSGPPSTPQSGSNDFRHQSFGALAREYVEEYPKRRSAKSKRIDRVSAHVDLIVEFFGFDSPLANIDRKRCREFRDFLSTYPAGGRKKFSGRQLTLAQLAKEAEAAKLPTLSWSTQDLYLKTLKDFVTWARREGLGWELDIADLSPNGRQQNARDLRHPFSTDQLVKIFNAPHFRGTTTSARASDQLSRDTRFWVPLLALLTGMRANEICQLETSDIREAKGGTWYLSVNTDGPDKSIKNPYSKREVPLHPHLSQSGFLEFVRHRIEQGSRRLFPELKLVDGGYSKEVTKWFNRTLLRQVGAHAPKTSFHSFRHNYQDALRAVEAPDEIKNALAGRSDSRGSGAAYGNGYDPAQLARYVDRIAYPDLDLSRVRWQG